MLRLNGSWAVLPGILALAGLIVAIFVNLPRSTEMSENVTVVATCWMLGWGTLAAIGLRADYYEWAKTARYPFIGYFLSDWLQRL